MRRASVSRRSEHLTSPPIRSRSSERRIKSNDARREDVDDAVGLKEKDSMEALMIDKPRTVHRRAMSDPFDAQEEEGSVDAAPFANGGGEASKDAGTKFSTLPRFPVAETRDKNCWSEPPITIFQIRGPEYFNDKKKTPSAPYLLNARGCDLFLTDRTNQNVHLEDKTNMILGGQLRRCPTLAINFKFPWGFMILYFEIPAKLSPYMNGTVKIDDALTVPERVLAAWLMGDDDYKNDRLKLIPYVAEGPWVVRNMVTGRPAIIGRKLPVSYNLSLGTNKEQPLLTATLDIGGSSATAKRIVSVCRRYMSALTVDIGFVIQAETERELPEQMMGSIRIHGVDPLKATVLS